MLAQIRKLLEAQPFEPFYVISSGDNRYFVASREHAGVSPTGGRMVIWFDDGSSVMVAGLHIASVEMDTAQSV